MYVEAPKKTKGHRAHAIAGCHSLLHCGPRKKRDAAMTGPKSPHRSAYGWEMAFSWCPPEDSPLLGRPLERDESPPPPIETGQRVVTRRYDRLAWLYDIYNAPMEWAGIRRRRRRLLALARNRVLEVGVGTGKNLVHYPPGVDVTGIDVSGGMLNRARRLAERKRLDVTLVQADVMSLPYPNDTFDTTVATCVFCSVADPIAGLRELGRVTKPGGQILLLEHVRPRTRLLGVLADVATVLTRRLFGFKANRRTEENVGLAGLAIVDVRRDGIWREMVVRPGGGTHGSGADGR